jgi:hypothetical protein
MHFGPNNATPIEGEGAHIVGDVQLLVKAMGMMI